MLLYLVVIVNDNQLQCYYVVHKWFVRTLQIQALVPSWVLESIFFFKASKNQTLA